MQVKFSPKDQTSDLGVSLNIIKFQLQSISNKKYMNQNFHSVAWVMPQGWDWGGGGQKL